jgi:hypothetical protein
VVAKVDTERFRRMDGMDVVCSMNRRYEKRVVIAKSDGKRPPGRSRFRRTLKKQSDRMWTGFIWHRIQTSEEPL